MTLAELEQLRAERKDPLDLPHTMTQREVSDYVAVTTALDRRLRQAHTATATLAELHEPDSTWAERLHVWRQTLCDELLALPPRIRDPKLLGVQQNLTLSIRVIDFGPTVLKETLYDLTALRLGALMSEAGFEVVGADPLRNFSGVMPWHGSIKEVEHRMKDVERRRAAAQEALDTALLDDDGRAKREAEAKEYRDALNSMRVKNGEDGRSLRVVDRQNDDVDEATLTQAQRKALERARRALSEVATT